MAALASLFPAESVATTLNECLPLLTFFEKGEEQEDRGLSSKLHSNEEGSLALNSNRAVCDFVFLAGCLVIVVWGGVVSGGAATVKVRVAARPAGDEKEGIDEGVLGDPRYDVVLSAAIRASRSADREAR